ncbi:hypothetical protein HF086_005116 [Spodoptera exigua]|uniref:Uncharacterized protein n=1 Tax=Spodoptera exigua TaxID=7107 RepID=A0A922MS84_SPOEX|nr:hypothetical protein HF086_005116 [Spodoptera exigua]
MPSGVIFVIYIPSSNYEHILRFGKPKDLVPVEESAIKPARLAVELRNKKSRSIPVHLTQQYYNEGYSQPLDNIDECDEVFTMENILQELLSKLHVEHVVWISDKAGNYFEIVFPLPTGDQCETMLHCLTQLGIGSTGPDPLYYGKSSSLAALGLVENNASNIVAAMLVSPLMGPVMSITFGTIISDRSLIRSGFESLVLGMFLSLLFGFIFGLILGSTEMPWGFGDWPTEEMKGRGNVRSLWMGVLWALTSGTGVALALLQGSAGPLIGIAISASLLPPVVNCGLYWALACIWLLLVLEDLNQENDEAIREKLEAAVEEALDDETYRKVKRMSYQSHNADEVFRTIGLSRTPISLLSSQLNSGVSTPTGPRTTGPSNVDDIAALDKLLTSLLGLKESKRGRSFISHRGTPRSSRIPRTVPEGIGHGYSRQTESWPERIYEDSVVRSVISSLRTSKRSSQMEEAFMTPK